MAHIPHTNKRLIERTPKSEWRFDDKRRMLCLAKNNTCKRLAKEGKGVCSYHGANHKHGSEHHLYKHGRFSIDFKDVRLQKRYESLVTDNTGNEIRESMGVLQLLIATDIPMLGSPMVLWQALRIAWQEFNDAIQMRPPVKLITESDEQFRDRMRIFNDEQQGTMRAAYLQVEKAIKGGEDDTNVRDRLANNADKLARASERDASRHLKLNQTVQLEYVRSLIIQIEQWRKECMLQIEDSQTRSYLERRFMKIIDPDYGSNVNLSDLIN